MYLFSGHRVALLKVERQQEEADHVRVVSRQKDEATMEVVVVVDETHEDAAEADCSKSVSNTCSEEVLPHGQHKDQTEQDCTWFNFQTSQESSSR
jgi:hypothetical protein